MAKKWLFIATGAVVVFLLFLSWDKKEESHVSTVQGAPEEIKPAPQTTQEDKSKKKKAYKRPRGISRQKPNSKKKRKRRQWIKNQILLPYTQAVIVRNDEDSQKNGLVAGTSAVGKTLHGIDTRSPDGVRVLLPYGMGDKQGHKIPAGSVLMGKASPRGDKIFLTFQRVICPSGDEFAISAHALDPKDFTAGVKAKRHGNLDSKLATAMGFSMLGTMGEIMAQKEALGGEYGRITVKSTLKDATLSGVSEVSNAEAQRRLEKMDSEAQTEYLTLPANTALIITLAEAFNGQISR